MISPSSIPLDPVLESSQKSQNSKLEALTSHLLGQLIDVTESIDKNISSLVKNGVETKPEKKPPDPKPDDGKEDKGKNAKKDKLEQDSLTNMYNLFPKIKGFFINKDKDKKFDQLITSKFAENLKKGVFFNMSKGILQLGSFLSGGGFMDMLMGILAMAFIDPSGGLFAMLINLFANLVVMVINMLATIIPRIIGLIANMIPVIIKAITKIFDAIVKLIPIIIETLIKLIPVVVEALGSIAGALIEGFLKAVPLLLVAFIKLVPVLVKAIIDLFTKEGEQRKKLFMGIFQEIQKMLPEIWSVIVNALKDLGGFLWDSITSIFSSVSNLWSKFGTPIMNFITSAFSMAIDYVIEKIIPMLFESLSWVGNWFNENSGKIEGGFENVINMFLDRVIKSLDMLAPQLEKALDMMIPIILTMVEKIVTNLPVYLDKGLKKVIPILLKVIDMLIPMLLKMVDFFVDKGVPLLITGFKTLLSTLLSMLKTILGALIPLILKLIPILFKIGWTLLKALFTIVIELVPVLWTTLMDVIDVIGSAAGDLISGLLKILGQSVLDFLDWIGSALGDLVSGLWKLIKDSLVDLGNWIATPFINGAKKITKGFSSFLDAMIKFPIKLKEALFSIIDNLINKVKGFFGFGGSDKKEEAPQPKPASGGGYLQFIKPKWLEDFLKMEWLDDLIVMFKTLGLYLSNIGKIGYKWEDAKKDAMGTRAVGDWNVTNDMIVQLHKGEMVVPQDTASLVRAGNQDFTKFNEGYKGEVSPTSSTTVNNVSTANNSTIENLLAELIKVTKEKEMKVEVSGSSGGSVSSGGEGTLNLSRI